jgi:hypothetical protein
MARTFDRQEERWLRSKNPYTLARLVKERGIEGQRKFRLVAVACCRRAWSKLHAEQQRALEVVERYSDGAARYTEMRVAVQGMRVAGHGSQPLLVEAARRDAWSGLAEVIGDLLGVLWSGAPNDLEEKQNGPYGRYWTKADEWEKECTIFCYIVRDSFADVFRPASIPPFWRTSAVLALARATYEQRDLPSGALEPTYLAVLADALEEAGCDNQVILEHLRGPGPHVRGCWAVDLLLGKS